MTLVLSIPDHEAPSFLKELEGRASIEAVQLSPANAIVLAKELRQIKEAHEYADAIKAGRLKSRPVSDLLNEL